MENKSNSSHEKSQGSINLYLSGVFPKEVTANLDYQFNIVSAKSKSDITLTLKDQNVLINDNIIPLSIFKENSCQIISSLNLPHNETATTNIVESDNDIVNLSILLKKNFKKFHSLDDFLSFFYKSNYFKSYNSLQLLVHQKGNSTVKSFVLKSHDKVTESSFATQEFNNIFNLIKKSKNKTFNQSQIQNNFIETLGNFLGLNITISNYSLILLASRNDFLPLEDIENENFTIVGRLISPYIVKMLRLTQINLKKERIKNALNHLPEKIILKNNDVTTINTSNDLKETINNVSKRIHLDENTILEIFEDSENLAPEILHYKRINLLGELLNTLRHELNNPLFGIKLSSDLLSDECDEKENQEILKEIAANSSRCQDIIKNFSLLFLKSEESPQIDLEKIINKTITLAKSETREIKKFVTIEDKAKEYITKINHNPSMLSQIIFNLIINSSQSIKDNNSKEKEIHINVSYLDSSISLTIEDTGPGISLDLESKVFESFFTTKEKGNGLGLAICKKLSQSLGGDIILNKNSRTGGASFTLTLPV